MAPAWSTRADFPRRLNRLDDAAEAYKQALSCEASDADRRLLTERLAQVEEGGAAK